MKCSDLTLTLVVTLALAMGVNVRQCSASDDKLDTVHIADGRADASNNVADGEMLEDEEAQPYGAEVKDGFKELVFMTLLELANEGRIDRRLIAHSSMSSSAMTLLKRSRYQGFCFQKTASGRYLPYICWKGGDRK